MATIAVFIALGGTSVAAAQLGRDTVASEQIVNGSIASADIGAGAVRSSDIRDGTITHEDVRDGTLRGTDMATNTVATRNLVDGGVHADDLDADSVTGRAVRDGSIGTDDVADGSITARDLADGAIPPLQKLTEDGPADVPSLRTLGSGARQAAAGDDPRLSDARTPAGTAGGDLTGDYPAPTLANGSIDAPSLFSSSLQNGATGTPTLRSLGTGGAQAAAGDDSRFPSTAEKSALAGTSGVPGAANAYVTDADPRNTNARTPTDGSVTAAKFASLPHGKMRQTGTCQTFTSGTFQAVRFDSLEFGSGVTFDDAADSLLVGTAGTYMITGEINWGLGQPGGNTGTRALEVYAGGNEVGFDGREAATATNTGQNATAIVSLPANAAVRAEGGQASGSTLALANPFGRCASLAVQWIGP